MAQSKSTKKLFNMAYSLGAAIVIIGALFKLNHISFGFLNGSNVLAFGLITEALIFTLSAFETPEEEYDWSKVYPELAQEGIATGSSSPNGMLSQKLDQMLQEASIDSNLMSSLGNSMQNFQGVIEGLSEVSKSVTSTQNYNEQLNTASSQMESLNILYQEQVEKAGVQSDINDAIIENTERLREQMEALSSNLSSLNGVYGGMLSAMTAK